MEVVKIVNKDKRKNIIQDKKIGDILIREQILKDFPSKELRKVIDEGKKAVSYTHLRAHETP